MHTKYNEKISEMKKCIQRKNKLNLLLKQTEQDVIKEKLLLNKLSVELEKENQGFLKLKSKNINSLFFAILGTKDQRFDIRNQELLKIKLKYDQCKSNLDYLIDETKKIVDKLAQIEGCNTEYEELINKKLESINLGDEKATEELKKLIKRKESMSANVIEIDEAIFYGEKALDEIENTIRVLGESEGWGIADLAVGQSTSMIENNSNNIAREHAEQAQRMLAKFKKELTDIVMMTGTEIAVGPFETFSDNFYDSMIFDWLVQDEMGKTLDTVKNTKNQLDRAISKLYEEKVTEECMVNQVEEKINHIIKSS